MRVEQPDERGEHQMIEIEMRRALPFRVHHLIADCA
jgi:hypothetical protein